MATIGTSSKVFNIAVLVEKFLEKHYNKSTNPLFKISNYPEYLGWAVIGHAIYKVRYKGN